MLKTTDNLAAVVNAVKYEVRTRKFWEAIVTENGLTRDDISDTAKEIASIAFPDDETVQTVTVNGTKTRTRYGNAVQAAASMLRKVIDVDTDDAPKDVVLRVSLSGEGGGSTVVPVDHPLYKDIVALLAGE